MAYTINPIDGRLIPSSKPSILVFTGEISVGKTTGIAYAEYLVDSNIPVTLNATKVLAGNAEIRFKGDGAGHAPVFDVAFTPSPASEPFDSTLNKINWTVFHYNGTETVYSNTVL